MKPVSSLARHVVQVASYLRYGFPPDDALREVGIDGRYSATYRRQVLDEAGDWNLWQRCSGAIPDPGHAYEGFPITSEARAPHTD